MLSFIFFGAGTGAWNVAINAQAVSVESKSDVAVMSGFHCLFSTGGLFGALIVSSLLELGFSLMFCTLAISSFMLLIVIFQWKNLLPLSEEKQSVHEQKKFSRPSNKVFILGILCFIAFMAEGSMLDWSAEFLRSSLNYDPSIAGIGYAVFSIAMASGRFLGDRIIQKLGVLSVFQFGSLIAASGFFAIVYLGYGYGELLGFFLIGIGASNIVPILFSSTGRLPATSSSFALTIVTTFGYIGMLVGPAFIGFIAEATSLSFAFLCISFSLVAVGVGGRFTLYATAELEMNNQAGHKV